MEQNISSINKRLIFQAAVAQIDLDPFGIHGVHHWYNVYNNCLNLWRMEHEMYDLPHEDDWFFWNFSMLHDCCRKYDSADPGHPARAARLIPDNDSDWNRALRHAILGHSNGKVSTNLAVAICWDADRLDLPRVGVVPNPKLMSTMAGGYLAENYARKPNETTN